MAGLSGTRASGNSQAMPAVAPPSAPDGSRSEERRFLLILVFILLLLAAVYPLLWVSGYRGSAEAHATIEVLGGILGLLPGAGFITRFWSLGQRFHLFVGLAFFANGVEDFVHRLLEVARWHGWVEP